MPVAAVCPVHGPFESRGFAAAGRGTTFIGSKETCPRCGRLSPVMDGTFDFDHAGIATVISAPQWSRDALDALQRDVTTIASAMRDETHYSDDRAYKLLEARVQRLEQENGELGAQLATRVREAARKHPRKRFAAFMAGLAIAIGAVASLPQAVDNVTAWVDNIIIWGTSLAEQGIQPNPSDVPPPPTSEPG